MTAKEVAALKKFAKIACKENGIEVKEKDMTLIEWEFGTNGPRYVMIRNNKNFDECQCYYDPGYKTEDHNSCYDVVVIPETYSFW